jgi:hypothetical protein
LTGPDGENLLSGKVVRRDGRTFCVVAESFELNSDSDAFIACLIREAIRDDKRSQGSQISIQQFVPQVAIHNFHFLRHSIVIVTWR